MSTNRAAYDRAYYAKHREARRAAARAYYAKHRDVREAKSAYARAYYAKHRDARKAYARAYYAKHRDAMQAQYAADREARATAARPPRPPREVVPREVVPREAPSPLQRIDATLDPLRALAARLHAETTLRWKVADACVVALHTTPKTRALVSGVIYVGNARFNLTKWIAAQRSK